MVSIRITFLCALVFVPVLCINAQVSWTDCSTDTRNTCRKNIEDVLLGNGEARRMEPEDRCWRIRQNFDCMQWQTSMCMRREEQDTNSDIILKAWRFLEGFCEKFKNWWTKSCYQTERLRRCENRLTARGRSVDTDSCRSYLNFRSCASSVIQQDCDTDDQRLLGVYLMDRGQQKSWRCPSEDENRRLSSSFEARRASNTRETNPSELMYSDSLSSLGACAYDIEKSVRSCRVEFNSVKETARDALDDDTRKEKICCGYVTFSNCVLDHLKEKCGDMGYREGKKAVDAVKSSLDLDCDDYDDSTCSGTTFLTATSILLLAIGLVLSSVSSRMTTVM